MGDLCFTTEVNEFETDQEIELIVSLNTVRQREKERLKTRKTIQSAIVFLMN